MIYQSSQIEQSDHQIDKAKMLRLLVRILPKANILSAEEELKPYECDGLAAYRCIPWLVVLPDTVDQVQAILRLCNELGVPVVARGAGTGLSGGALPLHNGILLSLARFNRILSIDTANRMAVVQPGVRNLAVSEAVAGEGLYYAPDPSSQIACTIGGNVAENSGGVHCLKYGLTTHNILRLKMLSMQGDLLTIGSHGLDGPGYDLLAVLTGSEGMLGIIVEVTVKLLPLPETVSVVLAGFDQIATAGKAVTGVIAAGLVPAGLEMMDNSAIRAAESFVQAGYPVDAAAVLLCEIDGTVAQVKQDLQQVVERLQALGASYIRVSENEAQRKRLWAGRKSAFPALGKISPDYYCMDGTIPRHRLAEVLLGIAALSEKFELPVANVFHAGDGNLHPLILYDANKVGQLECAERFGGAILELCISAGGTITGEHGVGMEKINHMCIQFSRSSLAQFHALKAAFDPEGLLNPGKAVPTLHRCSEFGAMHVHHDQVDALGLTRF